MVLLMIRSEKYKKHMEESDECSLYWICSYSLHDHLFVLLIHVDNLFSLVHCQVANEILQDGG